MSRRPFPTFVVFLGLGVVLLALIRPLFAQPHTDVVNVADPAQFPSVKIEPASGGATIEGKLKLSAITLKTDIGSTTIRMNHVRSITFQTDPEGKSIDIVQLTDNSIIRGHVTAEQFDLELAGKGEANWKKTDLREIRLVNRQSVSFVGVLIGLLTLTAMEIILGVDNVIFLAIVVGKLPLEQQAKGRKIGLGAALGTRILLLMSLSFLLSLTAPVFTLPNLGFLHDMETRQVSWRDIILLAGGVFLIGKSVFEIHEKLEHAKAEHEGKPMPTSGHAGFTKTIVTIAVIDIVFSLDSVITAIGMVEDVWVMIVAMVFAMLVMLYFAAPIGHFVNRHPTVKVLALSFLILIGVMLVAEGLGQHMDKGYIYAAMAFAVVVEMVNMKMRKPAKA